MKIVIKTIVFFLLSTSLNAQHIVSGKTSNLCPGKLYSYQIRIPASDGWNAILFINGGKIVNSNGTYVGELDLSVVKAEKTITVNAIWDETGNPTNFFFHAGSNNTRMSVGVINLKGYYVTINSNPQAGYDNILYIMENTSGSITFEINGTTPMGGFEWRQSLNSDGSSPKKLIGNRTLTLNYTSTQIGNITTDVCYISACPEYYNADCERTIYGDETRRIAVKRISDNGNGGGHGGKPEPVPDPPSLQRLNGNISTSQSGYDYIFKDATINSNKSSGFTIKAEDYIRITGTSIIHPSSVLSVKSSTKSAEFEYEIDSSTEIQGMETNLFNSSIEVYPNPVSDILHINSVSPLISVQIFNSTGKKVKSVTNSDNLDVSGLSAGMYILKIQTEDDNFTTKIIKKQ